MHARHHFAHARRGLALGLAFVLLVALTLPASAAGVSYDPTDPAHPELWPPLGSSPVTGAISGTDTHYFQYRVLHPGDYFKLKLSSSTSYYPIDMALYRGLTNDEFDRIAVSANPGDDESITWLVPPSGEGTYTVEIKTSTGAPAANWTLTWSDAQAVTPRLSGADRFETSLAISRSTFTTASAVVIANGLDFPDALAAAGLAGVVNGPVLLTTKTGVTQELQREIVRLRATKVYVVGGKAVVDDSVLNAVSNIGSVASAPVRLAGDNRYQTARAVAVEIWKQSGRPDEMDYAFVVRGDQFADALAVAPFAFHEGIPVLLTPSTGLSGDASSFLASYDVQDVIVAGGTNAVSNTAYNSISNYIDGDVRRWYGSDRYATAAVVAERGVSAGFADGWTHVALATGLSFPDALSGGAASGLWGGPLLLTSSTELSSPAANTLRSHASAIDQILVFGGTKAISDSVAAAAGGIVD